MQTLEGGIFSNLNFFNFLKNVKMKE